MLNFDLLYNLSTIASFLAGFAITIVIELIVEAKIKESKETIENSGDKSGTVESAGTNNPSKPLKIRKSLVNVITIPEKNNPIAIFAFLFAAIFLVTASISGTIISEHEGSTFNNLHLLTIITNCQLAIGFLFFFFGVFMLAWRTKKWAAIILTILIVFSLGWIGFVYFRACL